MPIFLLDLQYEARKYGVRSGMAGFIAKKLCPHLILWVALFLFVHGCDCLHASVYDGSVKNNFADYSEASKQVREVLARVSSAVEQGVDDG